MRKFRKLKLSALEKTVLLKIKKCQVKNIERPLRIGGTVLTHPQTRKPLTATYLNIPNSEAAQFRKLEKKGLISTFGKPEAYHFFRLTKKGKAQLRK